MSSLFECPASLASIECQFQVLSISINFQHMVWYNSTSETVWMLKRQKNWQKCTDLTEPKKVTSRIYWNCSNYSSLFLSPSNFVAVCLKKKIAVNYIYLFFLLRLFSRFFAVCLTVVLKLAVAVLISLYFQTFWPKWLVFFVISKTFQSMTEKKQNCASVCLFYFYFIADFSKGKWGVGFISFLGWIQLHQAWFQAVLESLPCLC